MQTPVLLLCACVCVQMAMITITVLGTPNLGNSFTKALGRIVGVMVGACQAAAGHTALLAVSFL